MGLTDSEKVSASTSSKEIVEKYVTTLADNLPKQAQPYVLKAAPILGKIVEGAEKLIPIIELYYKKLMAFWKSLEPYKPHLLLPSLIGFIMCFFGGNFLTIIAAVEAYRMCGYDTTLQCINNLIDDFKKIVEVNKKDDKVDADNDGVADVLQISSKDVIRRKTLLFLKTVDPKRISDAIAGINSGMLAVIATLKLEFAKTITLGNAIGSAIEEPVDKFILPKLEALLPEEYKKWAKPVVSYTIKSIAISIAWTLQRIISAFHSAIRGGLMFARNILHYLSEMGYVQINHEETYIDEIVGFSVALLGLLWQLRSGFSLPFPLNVFLFPFTCLEYTIIWMVSGGSK